MGKCIDELLSRVDATYAIEVHRFFRGIHHSAIKMLFDGIAQMEQCDVRLQSVWLDRFTSSDALNHNLPAALMVGSDRVQRFLGNHGAENSDATRIDSRTSVSKIGGIKCRM